MVGRVQRKAPALDAASSLSWLQSAVHLGATILHRVLTAPSHRSPPSPKAPSDLSSTSFYSSHFPSLPPTLQGLPPRTRGRRLLGPCPPLVLSPRSFHSAFHFQGGPCPSASNLCEDPPLPYRTESKRGHAVSKLPLHLPHDLAHLCSGHRLRAESGPRCSACVPLQGAASSPGRLLLSGRLL